MEAERNASKFEAGTPLLRVSDLRVQYPAVPNPIRAVDGVSLEVERGQTLALVGESGCGKSTLARAIVGLETPVTGNVHFDGQPVLPFPSAARRALAKRMQMVFQDPDASLNPRLTIHAAVSEGLTLHDTGGESTRASKVDALLEQVGLDAALGSRYPHELSGGQKQRVSIARALAVGPELLVCDEAVSALDVSIQAQILSLLFDLKTRLGLSYLFITHDLRVVRQIADRVAVMYLGQVVELAETERLFTDPRHPYTRVLLEAVPAIDGAPRADRARPAGEVPSPARPPSGCRFHPRCPYVMERCSAEAPPLYEMRSGAVRCFLSESDNDR
jgi:oligopeptide/dipeptide ABC transporter ATP-binding protein